MKEKNKRWLDTGCLRGAPETVDAAAGVITRVKVCSAGEAKGHGYFLDKEFIETVAAQGAAASFGLKARFGHPNMCSESLGTYIGRFKNFSTGTTLRDDGTVAECCYADLHLSDTARETPNGDLHSYILKMATDEPEMFGTSIVFLQGNRYRRNGAGDKVYPYNGDGSRNEEFRDLAGPDCIECKKLLACDCVDEPAANDGLFSAFSAETVAGRITEFLDLHPEVFQLMTENREIIEALSLYGDKFDEFLTRYQAHRACRIAHDGEHEPDKEATMPEKEEKVTQDNPEVVEELQESAVVEEPAAEDKQLSTEAAVQKALQEDRRRQAEIRELGGKFGFSVAAEQFALDGRSVDDFRKHILNKSPQEWEASLSIKNPATQASENALEDNSEGAEAVANIKAKRKAQYGS